MKKLALTAALLAASALAPAIASPEIGQTGPEFTATTITGETVSSDSLAGQKVILEWTNHLCPFVVKHYDSGNMQMTQKKAADEGYVWISVISSAPGKQGHVTQQEAMDLTSSRDAAPAHIVIDESGDIGRAWGARTTPHMFIMDGGWTVTYMGAIDSIRSANQSDIANAENYVLSAMASMTAGDEVATMQTEPYGCNVKY